MAGIKNGIKNTFQMIPNNSKPFQIIPRNSKSTALFNNKLEFSNRLKINMFCCVID